MNPARGKHVAPEIFRLSTSALAPTTRTALTTFLIGGPLIYVPVSLAFGGNPWALNPLTALFGAIFWILGVHNPGLWLVTWIPTGVAALACAYLLRRLATTAWYASAGRGAVLVLGSLLCGLVSGVVYLVCSRVALTIASVGSSQTTVSSYSMGPYSAGTRFAMLGCGVPVVMIIGALLGGGLAWTAYPRNRSQMGAARQ
jgi:hypothetical protein